MSKNLGNRTYSQKVATLSWSFWVTWHVRVESCCVQDSRLALVQCFSGGGIPRKLTWHWKIPKTNMTMENSSFEDVLPIETWGFSNVMFVFRWSYITTLFLLLSRSSKLQLIRRFRGKGTHPKGSWSILKRNQQFQNFQNSRNMILMPFPKKARKNSSRWHNFHSH